MDKRLLFNENVEGYDKWRPVYCKELFEDIIKYAKLNPGEKAIEVGIGTGQATEPFLLTGCEVTAIEIGPQLTEYTKTKYSHYKNFNTLNTSFEEFEYEEESVNIVYSATAFHWIPENIAYPKALKLLKPQGTLALFWNRPFIGRGQDKLHQQIQAIYQKYRPSNEKLIENDIKKYNERLETIKRYGFSNIETKMYHQTRTFTANDYIGLLNTYSDHRSMPHCTKIKFERGIRDAILEHQNSICVYDTMDLYLAKK